MGILKSLGRAASPQNVADTFLSGVGGGALGAGLGAMSSNNGDGLVPGMIAGAGAGVGARGAKSLLIALFRKIKQQAPDANDQAVMQKASQIAHQIMQRPDAAQQVRQILGNVE